VEPRREEVRNRIDIVASGLLWNGYPLARKNLGSLLQQVKALYPTPETDLVVRGNADCDQVEELRATLERTLDCSNNRACSEFTLSEWERSVPRPPAKAQVEMDVPEKRP